MIQFCSNLLKTNTGYRSQTQIFCFGLKGLKVGMNLEVQVDEPDVSPLAVQGPLSFGLMSDLFGSDIGKLRYFEFGKFEIFGKKQIIARSGYSKQGGFEIYLEGSSFGGSLWDLIWNAGQQYDIRPGCPNLIERIEGGLMSYGNEFTRSNNPWNVDLILSAISVKILIMLVKLH